MLYAFIIIQTYYQVVVASTGSREIQIVSDGITIVQENAQLDGIEVFDGLACNGTGIGKSLFWIEPYLPLLTIEVQIPEQTGNSAMEL